MRLPRILLTALALLPLAACQPQAGRLLLLDLTFADPLLLESTAAPWHAAGYDVEYRRFYPHLTRHDLARYRTVIVLGGREPEEISAALTIGDLAILTEWIRRDGVVILGYAADTGARTMGTQDRWIMNRWLAAQGTGLGIGTQPLEGPASPLTASALDNAGFAPFAAGHNYRLSVHDRSQTLARGAAAPVVAASRVNTGLVVVASRDLLSSTNEDRRARDFLVALARWTRRPAEWASVAPALKPAPLILMNAPRPVALHPPPLRAPAGAAVIAMPEALAPGAADARPVVPGWIARQGMRVFWSRYAPQGLESLLGFSDVAALNALATVIPPAALADTIGARSVWRTTAERLQTTSLRWFPGVALVDLATEGADEVDRHGQLARVPCGLDSLFWRAALRPTYRALARLGGARPDLIAGVALDLDSAAAVYGAAGFCDSDYREGLGALRIERTDVNRLASLPPTERYDTLLERGQLGQYYGRLEVAVAERATLLRVELRRLHPDLRFAFRASRPPVDWFSLGLMHGLATREAPVLLWTRERLNRDLLERYQARGVLALSALALDPSRISPNEWNRLRPVLFGEHHGFWVERTASDSVGRLIRRLAR